VQRNSKTFYITGNNVVSFKQQMLNWTSRFNICCFLDNHQYTAAYHSAECLAAAGAVTVFSPATNILHKLKEFYSSTQDWMFGHLGYGLQNETEGIAAVKHTAQLFKDICLFVPETVIALNKNAVTIHTVHDPAKVFAEIQQQLSVAAPQQSHIALQPAISKEQYITAVEQLQQHILKGDCYEINFCQEFFVEDVKIDPVAVYNRLTAVSPTPFAAFYRNNDAYALCASPERYLKKKGNKLYSQPIKGTIKRDLTDAANDALLRERLFASTKDRSENVMVVDLVRNDLSRICTPGTVTVEELYGIYSYPNVHQMISTITGTLEDKMDMADILRATFPMGSMTGAPKKKVLELIDQYEQSARGLFSGSIGYITPGKDFDFNVVIRSLFYNAAAQRISCFAGGGITFYSIPEEEYEESMLKAAGMRRALAGES
jgi:para-aminobenzoate synthetase component I